MRLVDLWIKFSVMHREWGCKSKKKTDIYRLVFQFMHPKRDATNSASK